MHNIDRYITSTQKLVCYSYVTKTLCISVFVISQLWTK